MKEEGNEGMGWTISIIPATDGDMEESGGRATLYLDKGFACKYSLPITIGEQIFVEVHTYGIFQLVRVTCMILCSRT